MMPNTPSSENSPGKDQKAELPSRVAQWYYRHGLFLSSYPTCATSIAVIVVYPLLNIPLPGTIPTKVILPNSPANFLDETPIVDGRKEPIGTRNLFNFTLEPPFPWSHSEPYFYVQQIVLRSSVLPWKKDLILTDAFRGPLHEIFKLLEIVRNHEDEESKTTLAHICLHVENVKQSTKESLFPEYNCLILSPANFWQQSSSNFNRDTNLLNTIFQHHNLHKSKVSTADMLLGMQLRDAGFKRYPIRNRPRVIQYAITLVLRENDQKYLSSLKEKLITLYPLHQKPNVASATRTNFTYIYYPGEFNLLEFMPLFVAFIVLFIYVYFSVRKIEVIKSRVLLAISAVITVLSSLMMSLGLCFFFGLTISVQSNGGMFQYLVILVGLENVLVLTKSVVSTDNTFDVKIRLAQGLSKEGWSISKTLLTEITILTIGLATFVPVIQEFCIFAIVGLISDFFLQMMLFSTVLALDIKRIEFNDLNKSSPNDNASRRLPYRNSTITSCFTINRSRSHPKLTALDSQQSIGVNGTNSGAEKKIPKRLRIVNFWARTRFFQRAFMIWMIFWIFSIIYNSQIFEQIFEIRQNDSETNNPFGLKDTFRKDDNESVRPIFDTPYAIGKGASQQKSNFAEDSQFNLTEQINKLAHPDFDTNYHLSNFHWSSILKQYNLTLSGKYITILPTIRLSHVVPPEVADRIRNNDEKPEINFQWKALAIALDPIDFIDTDPNEAPVIHTANRPLYPKSPMEIVLAAILCSISLFVLTYTMVVFYRCICTRNYAEWRSSWNDTKTNHSNTQRILEGVPIQVKGHRHSIECLVTDGTVVISSCLEGQVKVWNVSNGELILNIDRAGHFQSYRKSSLGDCYSHYLNRVCSENVKRQKDRNLSPIWCLDYVDFLIVIGCADGRLEFWEGITGNLKCIYECEEKHKHGITNVHLTGNRVIAARLSGRIDFLRLETYNQGRHIDWGFTTAYKRTHVRTGSTGSPSNHSKFTNSSIYAGEELRCILEKQHLGHQQSITCMEVVNGIVFTGSQDHTLKVFKSDIGNLLHTLHGHCGPITCLFIDHFQPDTGGSGSQDGLLCVWELLTGACMYSIQAHDGAILSLACAPSYVISVGADERLCVWERFQGHLLNTIYITHIYTSLLMLTPSLLITVKSGSLIVWDVRTAEATREVKLDCSNLQLCPKNLLPASGSVICDYGNELRIVRFPMIADKRE
ncbi:Sterol regulatory element-binding protein cleavage-activating protein, partial [Pseudolycoriella hygida]